MLYLGASGFYTSRGQAGQSFRLVTMRLCVRIPVGGFSLCLFLAEESDWAHSVHPALSDRKLSQLWDPASTGLVNGFKTVTIALRGQTECTEGSNRHRNVEGRWRFNLAQGARPDLRPKFLGRSVLREERLITAIYHSYSDHTTM